MKVMKLTERPISYFSEEIEQMIEKKEFELKELASKHAKHLARKNLPAPVGDTLIMYLEHLKVACESLAARVHQHLLPLMHKSEGVIESDFATKKHKRLDSEIEKRKHFNDNRKLELENSNASTYYRILIAGVLSFFIGIGDAVYNIESFQLVTANLLFATLFSIGCSFTALTLAHCIPIMYKKFTTRLGRIMFSGAMLTVIMLFFTALAIFRSEYLQEQEISVDSVWFVVVNLVFFLATLFVSALLLPTWEELKKNWRQFKVRIAIRKQKRKIHELFREKEKLRISEMEQEKHCARISHYMDSCNHRINKLFHDCAGIFKRDNIAYRSDSKVPDCFNEPLPDIDVNPEPVKPNDQ